MAFTEVARGIYAAPLFSLRETELILAISKRYKYRKAKVKNKAEGLVVKRDIRAAGVQYMKDWPQLAAFLRRRIIDATLPFSRKVMHPDVEHFENVQLIRYKPGGFYHAHKDNFGKTLENHREVTILVYLNEDFTGGETSFPKLEWAFKPQTGYVLLFPARYQHKAEAVIEGTKYVLAAWYRTQPVERAARPQPAPSLDPM